MSTKLIGEIERGGGEFIGVQEGTYKDKQWIDIRVFFTAPNGDKLPTKKGVTIRAEILHELIVALQKAEKEIVLNETYITEG